MVQKSVRIAFRKTGSLQFISHLDLMRTMKKVFVRSGVPLWYTEGFNPHPKMVFALPLSVGTESVCEKMDVKLNEEMPLDELCRRLNAALTEELHIDEVYLPERKFSDIAWAKYEIVYEKDITSARDLFRDTFVVTKHTKSGDAEVDIVPMIRSIGFDGNTVTAYLSASSERYLNPEYIARAVAQHCDAEDYSVMRREIYLSDGITPFR